LTLGEVAASACRRHRRQARPAPCGIESIAPGASVRVSGPVGDHALQTRLKALPKQALVRIKQTVKTAIFKYGGSAYIRSASSPSQRFEINKCWDSIRIKSNKKFPT
jgi:hypothetical protein